MLKITLAKAFLALQAKKMPIILCLSILGNFWVSVVIIVTFVSNINKFVLKYLVYEYIYIYIFFFKKVFF